jgi:hypothetical protein
VIFNTHSDLAGKHAFLSASKYHWTNYDEEKLEATFLTHMAAVRGTQLHELAMNLIRLGVKMGRSKQTLNMYVNDAIGFRMEPEQVLMYSQNVFGTVDAISFRKNLLRIHDLKTGVNKCSMRQLLIYAAIFCLEYGFKPTQIEIELRIYQNDDVEILVPDPLDVINIMDKIVKFDQIIENRRLELLS